MCWRPRTTPRVSFEGTETSWERDTPMSTRSMVKVVHAPTWI